ncbi:MAG: PEP-CTERM sorting domain-containing protein [Desulfuromusa sp.]
MKQIIFVSILVFILSSNVYSTPLRLDYQVSTNVDERYIYNFSLILDNNDDSWLLGQGFGWLIFGDAPILNTSPFTDFNLTSSPIGPWTQLGLTTGAHNGPTFQHILDFWYPATINETLTWSGTSETLLQQGQLFFSTVRGTPDIVRADFEVANNITPVSEPSTLLLLFIGFLFFTVTTRFFKRGTMETFHL